MKNYCGASDPNIDKAVDLFSTADTSADRYINAKKTNARQFPQLKANRDRDIEFKINKRNLNQKSFNHYYGNNLNLYKFVPKKKYTEELLNTD